MCVGVPMQVLSIDDGMADCAGRGRHERINTMLLADIAPGTWILAYQGSAVRVMSEDEARQTGAALDALEAASRGDADLDTFFADLLAREPTLPPHLKDSKA